MWSNAIYMSHSGFEELWKLSSFLSLCAADTHTHAHKNFSATDFLSLLLLYSSVLGLLEDPGTFFSSFAFSLLKLYWLWQESNPLPKKILSNVFNFRQQLTVSIWTNNSVLKMTGWWTALSDVRQFFYITKPKTLSLSVIHRSFIFLLMFKLSFLLLS